MDDRLKVLISAYACEPDKGSEPEVGWQWATQMAQHHDVLVLTRENNRPSIEANLARTKPLPGLSFVYFDAGKLALAFKRATRSTQLYYLVWQQAARRAIARLHAIHRFDLMHHVTFAAFRYPTAIWGHGAPTVWGPVGGAETIRPGLLPWAHPASLARETARNIDTYLRSSSCSSLTRRARASTSILASTREMQTVFNRLGFEARLMPAIGLSPASMPARDPVKPSDPALRLLFTGNVIALKGLDLALSALGRLQSHFRFTVVGDGNFLPSLRRQAHALGIADRVHFTGRVSRAEALASYSRHDLLLFPSLHDTGGYSAIEGMFYGLPVVCLDCAGPAIAVPDGCGTRVPLTSREGIVSGIAAAISNYARDRQMLERHGQAARDHVLTAYDWERKASEMSEVYLEATARGRAKTKPRS